MTPHATWNRGARVPERAEIVTTRMFDAPIALVFDVLTKPEHVSRWCARGETG